MDTDINNLLDVESHEVLWDYCLENNFPLPGATGDLAYNYFAFEFYRTQLSGVSLAVGTTGFSEMKSEMSKSSSEFRKRSVCLNSNIFPSLSGDEASRYGYAISISFGRPTRR